MSHFLVYALVPRSAIDGDQLLSTVLEEMLAPYDEQIEVKPYDQACWCIGNKARTDVAHAANEKFGTWDEFRNAFWTPEREAIRQDVITRAQAGDTTADPFAPLFDAEWKAYVAPRVAYTEATMQQHPEATTPMPECETCEGTGTHTTTYNPNSKWDWWRMGGRWDGTITATDTGLTNDNLYDTAHETLPPNAVAVADLLALPETEFQDRRPFAVVTADGWHERGKMGWWAMVSDEKSQAAWEAEYRALLEANADKVAVALDCHI